ncbi:Ni/Fe-hydrogenase cytochrome b subunit [Haloferula sp. A504]|uniref:Ni/Fe-hydrogenase cytochrome b subunit n=1 Tax=Haloferula sp. A504 TaxID=3373601 RepID=UPI0031C454F9|nr:Ni/Fe-hydrogenase cytochrome b subunit [Verrucomicrobiaceae bacterium E54]
MSHHEYQKVEGRIFSRSFFILLTFVLIGMSLIVVRFVKGIGAVSNMNDGYPWGIWIAYDVATGTAIACGGYAVAILVYIRNHMRYHPLMRSCILTSLFGYGLAGFSVMVDLGRPWNAYNFFLPSKWQFNSVMFEVALCVMAYSMVLLIEFLPAILYSLEKSKWVRFRRFMDWLHPRLVPDKKAVLDKIERVQAGAGWLRPRLEKILIFIIVLGITLPTMHQSSLGSMLLIAPTKLHPLWHTPMLPLLFLINAIFMGYSIVIFESIISSYSFNRPYESREIAGVSRVIPGFTVVWMLVVFGDLAYRGQLGAAFSMDHLSLWFLAQMVLVGTGSFLLLGARGPSSPRRSPRRLFISAALILVGGAVYRFNVYLIGFDPGQGWSYFPSLAEIMITVGIVSLELLGYLVLVKMVPVLPKAHGAPPLQTQNA